MLEPILLFAMFVIVITALFLAWYLFRSARNKERLLLIEKGIDLKDPDLMVQRKNPFPWLRIGIVLTGIALGCIVVALVLVSQIGEKFNHMPGFSIGVIVLFAGLSMVLANFVGGSKDQK